MPDDERDARRTECGRKDDTTMLELMTLIFEYRLLRAKTDRLSITLGDTELCRLAGLERLLAGEEGPRPDARRVMARAQLRAFVRYTLHNEIGAGELANIAGGGACIEASHPPAVGAAVLIAIQIAPAYEFVFPAKVVWRTTSPGVSPPAFGVEFDGVPTRRRLTHPVRTVSRSSIPVRPGTHDLISINDGDDERSSITEIKCKTPIPDSGTGSTQ